MYQLWKSYSPAITEVVLVVALKKIICDFSELIL